MCFKEINREDGEVQSSKKVTYQVTNMTITVKIYLLLKILNYNIVKEFLLLNLRYCTFKMVKDW